MGERTFKVCDQKLNGSSTCDARDVVPCVVCERDMCGVHRSNQTTLNVQLVSSGGTNVVCSVSLGATCSVCRNNITNDHIRELILSSITPEAIIRITKAHLSAEALK